MPYVVTEDCIKCKYMDCVDKCPVSCFFEGANMLVIHPEECIDCAVCEPTCPVDAIVSDDTPAGAKWLAFNKQYSAIWPRIVEKATPPADAKQWEGVEGKHSSHFDPAPGTAHKENVRVSRSPKPAVEPAGEDAQFS
jgi:ferredoxin